MKKHIILLILILIGITMPSLSLGADVNMGVRYISSGGSAGSLNQNGDIVNGVTICPGTNDNTNSIPGCDMSADVGYNDNGTAGDPSDDTYDGDLIVRTNDVFKLGIVWRRHNPQPGDTDTVTFTCELPEPGTNEGESGYKWDSLHPTCDQNLSSISSDGRTITCARVNFLINNTSQSHTESTEFGVRVLGGNKNGYQPGDISCSGDFDGDGVYELSDNVGTSFTVTASPRWNIQKGYSLLKHERVHPVTGASGFIISYGYVIEADEVNGEIDSVSSFLGNESLGKNASVSFVDDLSNISPNAELIGCHSDQNYYPSLPYPYLNPAYPDRSVGTLLGQQTVICPPSGSKGVITITHSNFDGSLDHYPSQTSNGDPLSVRDAIAAVGFIEVFVPETDVINGPDGLSGTTDDNNLTTTNIISGFDPTSISGISNFGSATESTNDNSVQMNLTTTETGPGVGAVAVTKDFYIKGVLKYEDLTPGEDFNSVIRYVNRTTQPRNDVKICDVIDTNTYNFSDGSLNGNILFNGSSMPMVASNNTSYTPTYTIEYGVGYEIPRESWDNLEVERFKVYEECNDSGTTWYTDYNQALAMGEISKIRISITNSIPPYTTLYIRSQFTPKSDYDDGTPIPTGTMLVNYSAYRASHITDPNIREGAWYLPGSNTVKSEGKQGDRVFLQRALARINKSAKAYNRYQSEIPTNSVFLTYSVEYEINWSYINAGSISEVNDIRIVDILPPGFEYIPGSIQNNYAEPIIGTCADAQEVADYLSGTSLLARSTFCDSNNQVLVWDMQNIEANKVQDPIVFRTQVNASTPSGVAENFSVISSPSDGSAISQRLSNANVTVVVSNSLTVSKSVSSDNNPLLDSTNIAHPWINYTVMARNGSDNTLNNLDIIDVLPFNGDGDLGVLNSLNGSPSRIPRTPGTSYSGSISYVSGSIINTRDCDMSVVDWYYSNTQPSNIDINPVGSSNDLTNGTTNRCKGDESGPGMSCTFDNTQVKAIRVKGAKLGGQGVCSISLQLATSNATSGSIYSNSASAFVQGLLDVSSNIVTSQVYGNKVSGTIRFDSNNDGIIDTGESVLSGALVTLTNTKNETLTTYTDQDGFYMFSGVVSNNYSLSLQELNDYDVIYDSDDLLNDPDGIIILSISNSPSTYENNNIGLGINPNISGYTRIDENRDGVIDTSEGYIGQMTIQLIQSGSVINTTQSDSNGYYVFTGLSDGSYQTRLIIGSDYVLTYDNDNGIDDPDGTITGIRVQSTDSVSNYSDHNFGLTTWPMISGVVWLDADGDGIQGTEESYLSGFTISLMSGDALLSTYTTESNGYYLFTGVAYGTYDLVLDSGEYVRTFDSDNGTSDPDAVIRIQVSNRGSRILYDKNDFGLLTRPTVSGTVWKDENRDSKINNSEHGINNMKVILYLDGNIFQETTTNNEGYYEFNNLSYDKNYKIFVSNGRMLYTYDKDSGSDNPDGYIALKVQPDDGIDIYDENNIGLVNNIITGGSGVPVKPDPSPVKPDPSPVKPDPSPVKPDPKEPIKNNIKEIKEYEKSFEVIKTPVYLPVTGVEADNQMKKALLTRGLWLVQGPHIYNSLPERQEVYTDESNYSFEELYSGLPNKYHNASAYFVGYGSILPINTDTEGMNNSELMKLLNQGLVLAPESKGLNNLGMDIIYGHTSSLTHSDFEAALLPAVIYGTKGSTFSIYKRENDGTYSQKEYIIETILTDVDPSNSAILSPYNSIGKEYIVLSSCQAGELIGVDTKRMLHVARRIDQGNYARTLDIMYNNSDLNVKRILANKMLRNMEKNDILDLLGSIDIKLSGSSGLYLTKQEETLLRYIQYNGSYLYTHGTLPKY